MRNQTLFASLALMLGACVGGIDMPGTGSGSGSGSDPGTTPRAEFDADVAPLVGAKCAACHVGPETSPTNMFLGQSQTNDSFYNGITNDRAINGGFSPGAASILTKGAHEGPAWSGTEAQAISSWLEAEAAVRGPDGGGGGSGSGSGSGSGGGSPNLSADGAEQQWAACMSISQTEYTNTQAYMIANMNSDNGRCYSCHEPGGAGGAYWGKDNNYLTMLQKWQEQVFITGAFQASAQPTSPVTYKMITAQSKICAKGQEKNNGSGTHPAFDCNQTVGGVQPLQTLEQFRVMVQAKADAGTCPAPAFAPPT